MSHVTLAFPYSGVLKLLIWFVLYAREATFHGYYLLMIAARVLCFHIKMSKLVFFLGGGGGGGGGG